ncbi:uncharacterized protein LOC143342775 [Colletes latitarsis]|uniref:uncharacterized protein LOC143342775 n=1 Tax=Colletes latitarsis TaxID=2605962 RepID=UPI00403754C6
MSQVCPSSSHQLVAASIAFQRARCKFPKNYGLYGNTEDTLKLDKTECDMVDESSNDEKNLSFATKKFPKSNHAEAKTTSWNDDCGENGSIKENLLQKPIICSCCRKRNEVAKSNQPMSIPKTLDQCNAGDTLDVISSKKYNGIAKKDDLSKSKQLENCVTKIMKSFITKSGNSNSCHTSVSHSRRRSPKETSNKLDSVNLLYDRAHDQVDNVKSSSSSEKQNCNTEEPSKVGSKSWKPEHRNSQSKVNFSNSQKDNSSTAVHHTCDFHCSKRSTFNLLRFQRDYYHPQNRHRCYHRHNCCHQCYGEEYHSCSSKEKLCLTSDTCLCSSSSNRQNDCYNKDGVTCEMFCCHDCCLKNSKKISTIPEQNDEEYDDSVVTINHKDSLCLLVEKYKANKKCKHKKYSGKTKFPDKKAKDEFGKSFNSETNCQTEESVNAKEREEYFNSDKCRYRDNRTSLGKACRDDCNQFKNLRSRLVKTGTCYTMKGAPWRHTF